MKKTQQVQKGTEFTPLGEDAFERPGFKLIGWNTLEHRDNTVPDYPLGQKVPGLAANLCLYACWQPIEVVTYLCDDNENLFIDSAGSDIIVELAQA